MSLRDMTLSVRQLQTWILQEYFQVEVSKHFKGDEWKDVLEQYLFDGVQGSKSNQYKGAYDRFRKKGKLEFQIEDMDVTILATILSDFLSYDTEKRKKNPFIECRYKGMEAYVKPLQNDRNGDGHSPFNETTDELFQWLTGSLFHLEGFLYDVNRYSDFTAAEKDDYLEKFQSKIEQLQKKIAEQYRKEIQLEVVMDYDIEQLHECQQNPLAFRGILYRKYFNKDHNLGYRFAFRCADKGIADACFYIADLLYSGEDSRIPYLSEDNKTKLKQNFGEAAKYYKKGFSFNNNLNVIPERRDCAMIRYISLCKNGIIYGLSENECDGFLNSNRENIEEYKAGDYTFYKFTDYRADYGKFYNCHDIIVY